MPNDAPPATRRTDEVTPASALERGRALLAELNPEMEAILEERYGDLVPSFGETLVEFAYGRLYARDGLDLRTRQIATVAALTAMGGQTGPQLKANIEHALKAGATHTEIAEVILQMSVYGGMPATINALNSAREVFADNR
ncbi:carboxymuconolactone decarboxylase family protein [Jannaschia sp. LMIT008]|uniref:carboxymuconolactone decarboxylase family protein n=1 Tax=Jannaschia maritima TaxID=3032585 RepID=UPI002810C927|nr:carboxymuconolactone decarboxylase family protein [Jannaschia sp. LMIT008]